MPQRRGSEKTQRSRGPGRAFAWAGLLPVGPTREESLAREALVSLYAEVVRLGAPPDILVADSGPALAKLGIPADARGALAEALLHLLRRRMGVLTRWAAAGGARAGVSEAIGEGALDPRPEGLPEALFEARLVLAWELCAGGSLQAETALGRLPAEGPDVGGDLARILGDPDLAGAEAGWLDAARLSMPVALLGRWRARLGLSQGDALARALGLPAPVMARANSILTSREKLAERLGASGFESEPGALAPDALRLKARVDLSRTPFHEGWFEFQDEGSQLVSIALDPKPSWRVLDACAGSGGKTLHLAAMMRNRGEVFAHDTRLASLESLRRRVRRSGAQNVRVLEPGSAAERGPFDAVLIDAPCLGLGTLRRNPDMAWRGEVRGRLAEMTAMQGECLRSYAPLVKPGGVLVYATCSLEPEENEGAVELLAREFPAFAPESVRKALEWNKVRGVGEPAPGRMVLLPHLHGTDGFFVQRFRRGGGA